MIRTFILVIVFFSFSFAGSKCKGWVGKPPQGAYCWEISSVKNEEGILSVSVDVYGYPQIEPSVLLDYSYAKLVSQKDIPNRLGIVNATRYFFIIKHERENLRNSWIKVKEHFRVKDSMQLK